MNVCVVTGTRAEYGLLYWLIKGIESDSSLNMQLVATGMHLSPEFGLTIKEIENDFKVDSRVEMLLSSDTSVGISKSIGLATISFSEVFDRLKPNLLIVLGDRYEIFSAVTAAMISRIPIAHISGGETTEGAFDESIRHSITKMSHYHFTATELYKKRVIQLGEQPERVYNVGGLGIDNIKRLKLLNRDEFETSINFSLQKRTFLVTFHPTTLEDNSAAKQFQELLKVFNTLKNTSIIFTKANSDTNGRIINEMIDLYVKENPINTIGFTSLGQIRYLSALKHVDCVIGNSSSGIAEAPSFKVPTINIGDRQKGRIMADSVVSCKSEESSIKEAIQIIESEQFKNNLKTVQNPYGEGGATDIIIETIKSIDLKTVIKKKFYDISF